MLRQVVTWSSYMSETFHLSSESFVKSVENLQNTTMWYIKTLGVVSYLSLKTQLFLNDCISLWSQCSVMVRGRSKTTIGCSSYTCPTYDRSSKKPLKMSELPVRGDSHSSFRFLRFFIHY